jgi:hypothetical protein
VLFRLIVLRLMAFFGYFVFANDRIVFAAVAGAVK